MRHSYEEARPSGLPRVDGPMVLVDGRRVQVAEWGPQDGTPVVFFHGSPGSRWVGNFRIGDFALEHPDYRRRRAWMERIDARLPER